MFLDDAPCCLVDRMTERRRLLLLFEKGTCQICLFTIYITGHSPVPPWLSIIPTDEPAGDDSNRVRRDQPMKLEVPPS